MAKSSKQVTQPQPDSFEAALAELEKIVEQMETGQMSLEDSLTAYKRGAELLQFCQNALKNAEQEVRILEEDMLKKFSISAADDR